MKNFLICFLFFLPIYVHAGCVSDSSGNQICTDADGNIISGGTTSTGGTVATSNCVSDSSGNQICTDADGNIISGGTTSTGGTASTPNCVSNASGGQICISSTGVVSGTDADGNSITPVDANGDPLSAEAVQAAIDAGTGTGTSGTGSGLDGADGQNGTGQTTTVNILPDFLTPLYTAFSAFCSWLLNIIAICFTSLFTMLMDVVIWSFDAFLILLKSILDSVDLSSVIGLIPNFSIPAEVSQILGLLGFGNCMAILSAAIVIRITLQLIPFVRLGS